MNPDLKLTGKLMLDERPMPMEMAVKTAHMVVISLQLASRHPAISDELKHRIEDAGRFLQGHIVDIHPEASALLEMGWHPIFDRDGDDY